MNIVDYGLYTIKDTYFETYKSSYFCDNKAENRPYYLSITDENGIIWMIPISSQVESYKMKIQKDMQQRGSCLFYHIGKIYGKERVFLIGNIFPITSKYLKKEYTYSGIHYIVGDKQLIKEVTKRAKKYLILVEKKKLIPNVDIIFIKQELLKE